FGVEIGERLVQQQQRRLDHQRARQGNTLLLTAGEVVWMPAMEIAELDHVDHGIDLGPRGGGAAAAHLQAKTDVLPDRHVRKQRVILEHHADIAPLRRQPRHILLTETDAAASRDFETRDAAQGRRLAAAGGAEQRYKLALCYVQIETYDRRTACIALAEPANRQARHRAFLILSFRRDPTYRRGTGRQGGSDNCARPNRFTIGETAEPRNLLFRWRLAGPLAAGDPTTPAPPPPP